MQIATTVRHARAFFDVLPRPLGFVPTMGALHEGHLALVHRAREACASVAASVFVNPLQFGPGEDLEKYPRDPEADRAKLDAAGVDVLFLPAYEAMYPSHFSTYVDAGTIGTRYEGAMRPTHFRGVTTVVTKLLNVVRPEVMFLGQKDAQQTAVLRKMVADLDVPTRIEVVPTIREADGLAMSSRNLYLSHNERAAAPTLHGTLQALRTAMEGGKSKDEAIAEARTCLSPLAHLDYLDVVDANTFEPIEELAPPAFIIGAARFGATRLLDNLWLQ